jgi:hypothetical protein
MPLEVGSEAPDFSLKDQNNQVVTLSSFRGDKNVLLVFYPLAFTGTNKRGVAGSKPAALTNLEKSRHWPSHLWGPRS